MLLAEVRRRAASESCRFALLVPRSYWDADTEESAITLELAIPLLEEAAGGHVASPIGAEDPFAAVREALRAGDYDEVIISTLPTRVSHWLHIDLPARAATRPPGHRDHRQEGGPGIRAREVTRWEATVEIAADPASSTIQLSADPRSLHVREGVRGLKPLTDKDRSEIAKNINDKVLHRQPISFRSSAVRLADGDGRLTVEGEHGVFIARGWTTGVPVPAAAAWALQTNNPVPPGLNCLRRSRYFRDK